MNAALHGLVRILRDGLNTNSYKFALARSLVKWARASNERRLEISRRWLAEEFVRLYWPLTVLFHLRQATDPWRDPVVMRLIRDVSRKHSFCPETKVLTLLERFPKEHEELVSRVERQAFRDVLPRFHTVRHAKVSPLLYNVSVAGVTLTPGGLDSLRLFGDAVDFMALGAWVRFTEQYSSAPHLFEKLEGSLFRGSLSNYRKFFVHYQGNRCFYCGLECGSKAAVDHMIPWSFVGEDRLWNLVLSCAACNSGESDRIPEEEFIRHLSDRNRALLSVTDLPKALKKDLREWLREDALDKHLRSLVDRCRDDGVGVWAGPSLK